MGEKACIKDFGFEETDGKEARYKTSGYNIALLDAFLDSGAECTVKEFEDSYDAKKFYNGAYNLKRRHKERYANITVRKRGNEVYLFVKKEESTNKNV